MGVPCTSDPDGMWTCTLRRPGGYQALVIWSSATASVYVPSRQYNHYLDLAGDVTSVNGPLNIRESPILLENSKQPLNRTIRNLTKDNGLRWLLKLLVFS